MKNKPLILGHRGYRAKFPENTILAFGKACEYEADGIECDVQKTKDNEYIIFHDDELSRVTGRKGFVADTPYNVIKKLDAGKGRHIPHIGEFLDSLPRDKFINIELKEETLYAEDSESILKMLEKRGLKSNILISSFKFELLPVFKKAGYRTGLLFEDYHIKPGIFKPLLSIVKYRPWSVNLPVELFSDISFSIRIFLLIIKMLRVKFIYWTVNTTVQYDAVRGHAYAVITDNIELLAGSFQGAKAQRKD